MYLQFIFDGRRAQYVQVSLDGVVDLVQLGLPVLEGDGGVVMCRLPIVELLLG